MSNTPVTWFEIGTDNPDAAQRFYEQLFGWTFTKDSDDAYDYRLISTGKGQGPTGGMWGGAPESPYASFNVQVDDVAATCARAEELGAKVIVGPVDTANGLCFAQIIDATGSRVGIWKPPAG